MRSRLKTVTVTFDLDTELSEAEIQENAERYLQPFSPESLEVKAENLVRVQAYPVKEPPNDRARNMDDRPATPESEEARRIAEDVDNFLFGDGAMGYDHNRLVDFVTHKLSGVPAERPLNYSERVRAGLES